MNGITDEVAATALALSDARRELDDADAAYKDAAGAYDIAVEAWEQAQTALVDWAEQVTNECVRDH